MIKMILHEEIGPEEKFQLKLLLRPIKKINLPHWTIEQKKKSLQQLKLIKNSIKLEKSN